MNINGENVAVVVPWHNESQIISFGQAWGIPAEAAKMNWLIAQRDIFREGCAVTKNKGIAEALRRGADIVVVLDDDCFPTDQNQTLFSLVQAHVQALQPQEVEMILPVTQPISRGTPYRERKVKFPVAASMGFWTEVGDYDAPSQLVYGATHPMEFKREPMLGRYFSLCGMNLAFRPKEWAPWCQFIDVPRFDDIWMGWLWQREAYRRGYCFNLNGPWVRHSRQSNVWRNLQLEAQHLQWNETGWKLIATKPYQTYDDLRKLLPV